VRPYDQSPIRRRLICELHRVQDETRATENLSPIPNAIIPHEPNNGLRQRTQMIFQWKNRQQLYRAWLDWGASVPILNDKWARRNTIPIYTCPIPKTIENFTGTFEVSMGHAFSYPSRKQH
jgi:hypothetical protein